MTDKQREDFIKHGFVRVRNLANGHHYLNGAVKVFYDGDVYVLKRGARVSTKICKFKSVKQVVKLVNILGLQL